MDAPTRFSRVVDGIRYDVAKAELIADDVYWDGHNWERRGRNMWLYRTARGRYFTVTDSQWQGEGLSLQPVTQDEARRLFEGPLSEHYVGYEDAFPGVMVEDA